MPSTSFTLGAWVRATSLGWTLGLVLTIAAALAGEAVGLGGSQALVGLGMGAGVGLMQGRALRNRQWWPATALGLGSPFLLVDLSRAAGTALPYSLYVCVALGGLAVGLWQARLLRAGPLWVAASVLGWSMAAACAAAADQAPRLLGWRGLPGALLYLSLVAVGGPLLGLATGSALRRREGWSGGRLQQH